MATPEDCKRQYPLVPLASAQKVSLLHKAARRASYVTLLMRARACTWLELGMRDRSGQNALEAMLRTRCKACSWDRFYCQRLLRGAGLHAPDDMTLSPPLSCALRHRKNHVCMRRRIPQGVWWQPLELLHVKPSPSPPTPPRSRRRKRRRQTLSPHLRAPLGLLYSTPKRPGKLKFPRKLKFSPSPKENEMMFSLDLDDDDEEEEEEQEL